MRQGEKRVYSGEQLGEQVGELVPVEWFEEMVVFEE
jgi:hypothetical protein